MSGHWYNLAGELVPHGMGLPSPTTILSVRARPGLDRWRVQVGDEVADIIVRDASDLGTRVHAAVENYLAQTEPKVIDEDMEPYWSGFRNWFEKYQPKSCQPERFVLSSKYNYAGRADLICEIEGKPIIVDFKTSKRLDPGMGLQLRAYQQAWLEMSGVRAGMLVVQLTPTTKRGYRTKSYSEPLGVFLAHKKIFDWQRSHERQQWDKWDGGMLLR